MHVRGCSRCTKVESALVARLKIPRHVNLAHLLLRIKYRSVTDIFRRRGTNTSILSDYRKIKDSILSDSTILKFHIYFVDAVDGYQSCYMASLD